VKKPEADPVVARNRKAAHDYHLGESWEAGIVLQGAEVKALRAGRASLVGGFAAVEDQEIWLHGVHIPQYSQARWFNDGSRRKRKLLLHRAQIDKIERKVNESGLTIVPGDPLLQGRSREGGDRPGSWQEDLGQAARARRA
jgi:SsrA-binding protein